MTHELFANVTKSDCFLPCISHEEANLTDYDRSFEGNRRMENVWGNT